jgi:predicted GNAT family N-acyltransferase
MTETVFCKILTTKEEIQSSRELRNEVLRKPLGMNLFDEDLEKETIETVFGLCVQDTLVGTVQSKSLPNDIIKLRQMAVASAFQGKGLGKILVEFMEQHVKNNGFKSIELHARKNALQFYLQLQYVVEGDEYLEVGIPHFTMKKTL